MIFLIVSLSCICIVLLIITFISIHNLRIYKTYCKEWNINKSNLELKQNEIQKLKEQEKEWVEKINNTIDNYNQSVEDFGNRRKQLFDSLDGLNTQIQIKQSEISNLLVEYSTKTNELYDIKLKIDASAAARDKSNAEIEHIKNELESIKAQKVQAIERLQDKDNGRVMEFNDADIRLTETLDNLKLQYPQLADAFSAIGWTKIWQSKFQAMTADLLKNKTCGIYRIWTKDSDEIVKSYIGQAVDIRERWSQHIKKMLGVTAADNTKLYNCVRPWTAHFEIIEEVDGKNLNEREHYWIEYYSCVNNGYNMKR